MDEMCGADGRFAETVSARETGLAAPYAESPDWLTVIVHVPVASEVTTPTAVTEQTPAPEVTAYCTSSPLEEDAFSSTVGSPTRRDVGCGNVIVWLSLPTSIDCVTEVASR